MLVFHISSRSPHPATVPRWWIHDLFNLAELLMNSFPPKRTFLSLSCFIQQSWFSSSLDCFYLHFSRSCALFIRDYIASLAMIRMRFLRTAPKRHTENCRKIRNRVRMSLIRFVLQVCGLFREELLLKIVINVRRDGHKIVVRKQITISTLHKVPITFPSSMEHVKSHRLWTGRLLDCFTKWTLNK